MEELSTEEKVDRIYTALVGDKMGNKGLVKRLEDVEGYVSQQKSLMAKISGASLVVFGLAGFIIWAFEKLWHYLISLTS